MQDNARVWKGRFFFAVVALANASTETRSTSRIIDCIFFLEMPRTSLQTATAWAFFFFLNLLVIIKHHLHKFKIHGPVDGGHNIKQNWAHRYNTHWNWTKLTIIPTVQFEKVTKHFDNWLPGCISVAHLWAELLNFLQLQEQMKFAEKGAEKEAEKERERADGRELCFKCMWNLTARSFTCSKTCEWKDTLFYGAVFYVYILYFI